VFFTEDELLLMG